MKAARTWWVSGFFFLMLITGFSGRFAAQSATPTFPITSSSTPSASPVETRPSGTGDQIPPATGSGSANEAISAATTTAPIEIEVGLYLNDVAKLDLKECEFFADFYIWYKIDKDASTTWTPDTIEFSNGTIELASPLSVSASGDGRRYWSQRIKGKFRGKFNLHLYPFDTQVLPIIIEDRETPYVRLQFVPDPQAVRDVRGWIDPKIQVPDWKIAGANLETERHQYQTDFGLANGDKDSDESYYSRLSYSIKLERLFIPHMIKFMIPLMVIAGMAYMVFYITAKEFESQCAICVTSLLSAVALHISQSDALPAVGYLVVSDKIFILFYMIIFSALVQTVMANNYSANGEEEKAVYLDQLFRYVYPLGMIVGCIIIALTSGV